MQPMGEIGISEIREGKEAAKSDILKWQKVDEYHIRRGEMTIAKCFVDGVAKYMLWEGKRLIDCFDDSAAAKLAADKGK